MKTTFNNLIIVAFFTVKTQLALSQNYYDNGNTHYKPINDPTPEGQMTFVEDLMNIAGYNPEKIEIYQSLPNDSRVFRVRLDSVNGGFVFIRWNKSKKENYVANKMIDPGIYLNLKAAKEIMRKQTNKAYFNANDPLIQAQDQEQISGNDLNEFREEFELKQEEKKLKVEEALSKKRERKERKEIKKKEKKKFF